MKMDDTMVTRFWILCLESSKQAVMIGLQGSMSERSDVVWLTIRNIAATPSM